MSADRQGSDLGGLADLLFSRAARAPAPSPDAPSSAASPRIEIVTATACGDAQVAPLLAVALAALPYARPQCLVFGLDDEPAPGWFRPLRAPRGQDAAPSWLAELEQGGGRALVVVPPRDTPEKRALGLAGARHVVWARANEAGRAELRAFLDGLHLGRAGATLGWLGAHDDASEDVTDLVREWSGGQEGRQAIHLGRWAPGRPLPDGVGAFLDRPVPPPLGSLEWAWSLLDSRAPRS